MAASLPRSPGKRQEGCGRDVSSRTDADLRREVRVVPQVGEPLAASWHVAPSQPIPGAAAELGRPQRTA